MDRSVMFGRQIKLNSAHAKFGFGKYRYITLNSIERRIPPFETNTDSRSIWKSFFFEQAKISFKAGLTDSRTIMLVRKVSEGSNFEILRLRSALCTVLLVCHSKNSSLRLSLRHWGAFPGHLWILIAKTKKFTITCYLSLPHLPSTGSYELFCPPVAAVNVLVPKTKKMAGTIVTTVIPRSHCRGGRFSGFYDLTESRRMKWWVREGKLLGWQPDW
jgi:hypothetical protein